MSVVDERVDVVVVGAGLGGLGAAVTLADLGYSVLVLEQGHQPGGYAVVFERGPFRFDACLHGLDGMAPGGGNDALLRRLGVVDRIQLHRLDPLYTVLTPQGPWPVPADLSAVEEAMVAMFPGERDGIRAWFDDCRAVVVEARRVEHDAQTGQPPAAEEWGRAYPTLARLEGLTFAQATAARVSDPMLAMMLVDLGIATPTPPSRLAAPVGMLATGSYGMFGIWYPAGGGAAIPRALTRRLEETGGAIEYGQTVTGLTTESGRVTSVVTGQDRRVGCAAVVCNAATPTLPGLLGPGVLPEDYSTRLTSPSLPLSSLAIYLGLDRDIFAERGLPSGMLLFGGTGDIDADHAAARAGDWDSIGLMAEDYTHLDPGCAPDGGGVVHILAGADYGYADTWGTAGGPETPEQLKNRVADRLLARAEQALPGLGSAIVHREIATPVTNQRYTLNPGGSWAGYDCTPDTWGRHALGTTTPVPNLFLGSVWTGSTWTRPPGQTAALAAGETAAEQAHQLLTGEPARQ